MPRPQRDSGSATTCRARARKDGGQAATRHHGDDGARPRRRATATTATAATAIPPRSADDGCKAVARTPKPKTTRRDPLEAQARPARAATSPSLKTNCGTIRIAARGPARAEDRRVVRRPRAPALLRRPDVPPHRQAGRQRLRHPGRRPAADRQRRPGLQRRREAAEEDALHPRRRRDGEDRGGAAGHVGQPVLHRHGARTPQLPPDYAVAGPRRRRRQGREPDRRRSPRIPTAEMPIDPVVIRRPIRIVRR